MAGEMPKRSPSHRPVEPIPIAIKVQSLDYRTFQRIERNPRVSARFAFACGPRERRRGIVPPCVARICYNALLRYQTAEWRRNSRDSKECAPTMRGITRRAALQWNWPCGYRICLLNPKRLGNPAWQ